MKRNPVTDGMLPSTSLNHTQSEAQSGTHLIHSCGTELGHAFPQALLRHDGRAPLKPKAGLNGAPVNCHWENSLRRLAWGEERRGPFGFAQGRLFDSALPRFAHSAPLRMTGLGGRKVPTQAKGGLEWGTRRTTGPSLRSG